MFAFVLVSLFAIAAIAALISLSDSALRGKRAYEQISAEANLHRASTVARVTIVGEAPRAPASVRTITQIARPIGQAGNSIQMLPAAA